MGNKFLSSIAAAAVLSTGVFFTGCAAGSEASAPKAAKHADKHEGYSIIKYEEAKELLNSNSALFLDARPMKLYKKGTIPGSLYMNSDEVSKLMKYLPGDKGVKLVSYCNGPSCHRSHVVAKALVKAGYTNVVVYAGGQPEWEEKKEPQMALKKKCKAPAAAGAYKPPLAATEVNGVKIHLLPEDGEPNEDGIIDQFWLEEHVKNGTVPAGINIVDVRKAEKYAASHVKGAISVPFKDDMIDTAKLPKDGIIVFYCNTGMKSTDARTSIEDEALLERTFIFDATYKCDDKFKNCKLTPNEPL